MLIPLSPYPAALIKTEKARIIVIADLHIGWEIELSQNGIHVPTQTPKLLARLEALLSEYKPTKLVILGDVKHTVAKAEMGEWRDVPDFFNNLKNRVQDIVVIRGNHDGNLEPLLPESVRLLAATGEIIANVGFFHGHQWPSPGLLKCKTLVMGHAHPVVALRDAAGFRMIRQVWVKARYDRTLLARALKQRRVMGAEKTKLRETEAGQRSNSADAKLFIMPSFNDFLGGRPINESVAGTTKTATGPLLRSNAVDIENAETYLLDGTFLGLISQLKTFN